MLVHRRLPGMTQIPEAYPPGRPMLTVIGDVVKRFLRATKPPARVGAGMGAIVLQRLLRAVLWVNMYVAAGGGIATWVAGRFVALALVAVLMVTAHTVLRLVLM